MVGGGYGPRLRAWLGGLCSSRVARGETKRVSTTSWSGNMVVMARADLTPPLDPRSAQGAGEGSARVRELRVPPLRSLAFLGDDLIDWLGGRRIASDGTVARFGVGDTYRFDCAIGLDEVGLLYEALGTKGLLVRWNRQLAARNLLPLGVDWIREVNRSFYQAEHYSFPACLLRLPNGRIALAHCPHEYNRLEIEVLDGTRLTQRSAKDRDFFHANLEVSPDGRFLLSNGWVWQPPDDVG